MDVRTGKQEKLTLFKVYEVKNSNPLSVIFRKDSSKCILVFLFFCLTFGLIYFPVSGFPSLDDPFFHIRFAQLLRDNGFGVFRDFHWLYFSNISQSHAYLVYYNFLFYFVLIPFTFLQPLYLGIKLYGVLFASLSFTFLYFFLLKIEERNAFYWTVALFAMIHYCSVVRFMMMRPFALAPSLLLIELYFLYRKKYGGIFLISFIYLFWHSVSFMFPLGVATLYFLLEYLFGKKPDWKTVVSSFLGTALAVLLVQLFVGGFYQFMTDIYFGLYNDTVIGNKVHIAEGSEIYPVNLVDFMRNNVVVIVLYITAVVFDMYRYLQEKKNAAVELSVAERKIQPLKGTLLVLSGLFMFGSFLIARNGDFFVFFSAAYIVMSMNYIFQFVSIEDRLVKRAVFPGIVVAVSYLFAANLFLLQGQIASSQPYNAIEGAAQWLQKNTPKKSVVFHPSWGWFPTLFYFNQNNYYIAGIEPRFLYDYDKKLYWLWLNISLNGYVCDQETCDALHIQKTNMLLKEDGKKLWYKQQGEQIAEIIRKDFQSRFILTSTDYNELNNVLDNSEQFEKVFADTVDTTYFVYRVKLPFS